MDDRRIKTKIDMAGNIDVVVSIRTTHEQGKSNVPLIMVCYDSRTDKLIKVKNLFSALDVSGVTPEGLCFEAIQKDLIPGTSNQDSYFINFSDGQPYFGNNEIQYQGERAENHTKKMCNNMRAMGISVLSYFIGGEYEYDDDNKAFTTMYGKDAEFINATNMMQVASCPGSTSGSCRFSLIGIFCPGFAFRVLIIPF